MRILDLPVLAALTVLSWLPPLEWKAPAKAPASVACACRVRRGRELGLLTVAELRPPVRTRPTRKGTRPCRMNL